MFGPLAPDNAVKAKLFRWEDTLQPAGELTEYDHGGAAKNADSIFTAPNVTSEMCAASFWQRKDNCSDEVIMTESEMAEFNRNILATEGTHTNDLPAFDGAYDGAALARLYADFKSPEGLYLNGAPVPESYYEAIRENIRNALVTNEMPYKFGFAVNRTVMKDYPYEDYLSDDPSDPEWDELVATGILVNEPLVILFTTADGKFTYVYSQCYSGWAPSEDIAVCESKAEWESLLDPEKFLVVTGEKVYLEPSADKDLNEKLLTMGTILRLDTEYTDSIAHRLPWNNHVVKMPARDENGKFYLKDALISANRDVNVGFLPYTSANVLTQAFKSLGDRYGWGGMMNAQDCSAFAQEVYRCFGFMLAHNTSWQAAMPAAFISALFMLITLAGCGTQNQSKLIKIAVMGNPADFPQQYEEGIKKAAEEANEEYSANGYNVECEFYGDNGSYEEGTAIIDSLADDDGITAIIGSPNMDINKTAAHVYSEAGKLFIVPYFLYDSVYEDNNYSMIFSMCNSARSVGECLRIAAENTSAKRWAVCAAGDEFSTAEMNGFTGYSESDGIQIVDCVNAGMLENNFDRIYERWEILGVEGVMMFPGDVNGFELFKAIHDRDQNMVCGGDTVFDDHELLMERPDILRIIPGFIMADEYTFEDVSDDGKSIFDIAKEHGANTGKGFDTWFFQGYNAVRMVADTAVGANTADSAEIAELLHENGYNGLCQKFMFDEKGKQYSDKYRYCIYSEGGYSKTIEMDKK